MFGSKQLTPCCLSDFNQAGSITVQDIFDFPAECFTASPPANFNGSGSTTVPDHFELLEVCFGGT